MASDRDTPARVKQLVCEDTSDSLDEAARLDAIIIDFSKAFELVPHDRLLKKLQPRVWIQGWSYGLGNF